MTERKIRIDHLYSLEPGNGEIELKGVSFFNSNAFIFSRNYPGSVHQFFLLEGQTPVGKINVYIENNTAKSFTRSTYGSIETSKKINDYALHRYVELIISELKDEGINSIHITHYPEIFNLASTDLSKLYLSSGFKNIFSDINQFIQVNHESFYEKAKKSRKHLKLNRSYQKGYTTKLEDVESLKSAYEHILQSRKRKNFSLSMTYEQLEEMFLKFPEKYLLFVTRDEEEIISVVVGIVITRDILYTFYTSGSVKYNADSPTVFTLESVYNYAKEHGFSIVDLGRSAIDEDLNEGVYDFKKSLGADECFKRQFYIEL